MTPEEIRKLAGVSQFIAGIDNYCDRWCERCLLSHRCLNYAVEKSEDNSPGKGGLNQQKMWDKLQARLQTTLQMLEEELKRRGVDLSALDPQIVAAEKARELRRQAADQQPVARAASDYGSAVRRWFEGSEPLFKTKNEEFAKQLHLEIGRPLEEAEEICELVDILQWYHFFIHTKLVRALGAAAEDATGTDSELRWLSHDGDGSAKIGLIAIDRSLGAWTGLRAHFPEQEDAILDFQVQLARIRKETEKLFPNARAFVRPGFDEEPGQLEGGG